MSQEPVLVVEQPAPGITLVTLNRPDARNALSLALRVELVKAFNRLEADAATRVIVLTGAGKAFCAGLDLQELGAMRDPTAAVVPPEESDAVLAMSRVSKPIIGAINGPAVTGGFELALACDILIASTHARFADTHARVGVLPGWGLSQKLSRLIGIYRAKEMTFTGNFLSAERAEAWGLVNRVVPAEDLIPQSLALAKDMLAAESSMLAAHKTLIDDGFAATFGEGLKLEKQRSRVWSQGMDSKAIAERRKEISERGRAQNAQPGANQAD